nr:isoform 4 of protein opaque10 [Quercus suber]
MDPSESSSSPSSSFSSSSSESSFRELDDVFLQTQTRIWLGEVLQIRLEEQMTVSDLLADGELLYVLFTSSYVSIRKWTLKCKL